MRAFRFRLESVLGVRRFEDERARQGHARARQGVAAAKAEHEARRVQTRLAADGLGERLDAGMPAALVRSAAAAVTALGGRVAEAETGVRQAVATLAERQGELREARTRLRALEKLRAKAEASHRRESLARAQRELDELATLRARIRS